ncbi:hypothetical protein DFJ74DRAFT_744827 [Hyaloraphidium curvatum]|nr:hypothetical protein DFJ74DRAFT_744827 [Hyaloraphidium curvatum]
MMPLRGRLPGFARRTAKLSRGSKRLPIGHLSPFLPAGQHFLPTAGTMGYDDKTRQMLLWAHSLALLAGITSLALSFYAFGAGFWYSSPGTFAFTLLELFLGVFAIIGAGLGLHAAVNPGLDKHALRMRMATAFLVLAGVIALALALIATIGYATTSYEELAAGFASSWQSWSVADRTNFQRDFKCRGAEECAWSYYNWVQNGNRDGLIIGWILLSVLATSLGLLGARWAHAWPAEGSAPAAGEVDMAKV